MPISPHFQFVTAPPASATVTLDSSIRTKADLLSTLARALHFPDSFGHNWDALVDCLSDLSFHAGTEATLDHSALPSLPAPDLGVYLGCLEGALERLHNREVECAGLRVVFRESDKRRIEQLCSYTERFNAAMVAKERRDGAAAAAILRELLADVPPHETKLISIVCQQLGHVHAHLNGDSSTAEIYFRQAVAAAPRSELSSGGLFNSLVDQDRCEEALAEAIRFLSLRESTTYRELFSSDGYGDDLSSEARQLLGRARELIATRAAKGTAGL